ncbi:InlB B-repeat-containing protein [Cohnella sp. WQ 127256]|uniref:InlB B-repeat-containing protein n=1 Tax=Cohnella sp. WQ 127256 TaxID=2938790 RepID=UPI00211782D4|nr:InlB B-repeat-containing protein [Cohnella sp. WQ 127256]
MDKGWGRTEDGSNASMKSSIRTKMRFACLFLLAVLMCVPIVPGTVGAVATGVTDGTYDFGGTLVANDSVYNKTGDKFLVSKDLVKSGTSLWPQTQLNKDNPGVIILKAEGTNVLGSFTFQDLGFSAVKNGLKLSFVHIALFDSTGAQLTTIDNYQYAGGSSLSVGTGSVKLSTLLNKGTLFKMDNVSMIKILWTFEDKLDPSRLKLDNISIANVQKAKFNVSFNSNGGTPVSSQTVIYNSKASAPADPTRTGYTFGGWYKEAAMTTTFNFATAITSNTEVFAKWTPINYTVTFNSNGGSAVSGQTLGYDSIPVKPPEPYKIGNSFGGWYTDAAFNTPYTFSIPITGSMILHAKWTLNNYTVTFNSNGGTAVSSKPVSYNSTITAPTAPTRTGYTFGGWYKEEGLTTAFVFTTAITGNTTLYAKWTLNNYTVTFNSNGGTAVSSKPASYNSTITAPTAPTRTGYTFGGWYKEEGLTTAFVFTTAITGNTTLYAKWTINNYTVTFNSNGGTTVSGKAVSYNGTITAPIAPTKTGSTFGGWYKEEGLTTAFVFSTAITGDTTLYAKWTLNNYTVTFNSNGGTTVSGKTVSYNGTITAPTAPTRTGYTFGGWYKEEGLTTAFVFTTAITGNTTLYAKWTINTYTVTFDSNDGSTVISQTVSYNSKATTPANPTKTGSTFGGWYKDEGLTTPFVFTTTAITENTRLYAKWVSIYTVTFNSNGGTTVSSQAVSYNSAATEPTAPTKTGNIFGGWYTDVELMTPYVFTTLITGNTVLRAKWTPIEYTVTFDSNGGTAVDSQTVSYNSKVTPPEAPTNTGSTFGWWYTDAGFTTPFLFTTPITGNTTLYAKWTTDSYVVMFDSNEGSTVSVQAVIYNSMATEPAEDPMKTGYTFGGWFKEESLTTPFEFTTTAITGNTTLYAKWTPMSYTVTFNSNGGALVSVLTVSYNSLVTTPDDPTKPGYMFEDWYTDAGFTTPFLFTTPITGNTTLYANWTPNSYAVTFDSNEGSAVSVQEVTYNSMANKPAEDPTKTGYTFGGWYEDVDLTIPYLFTTVVTGDTTLYAKWEQNDYKVTFISNGGMAVSELTVSYNSTATAPIDPTKPGHTFESWYTDVDLTNVFTFTTAITDDITLYANWTPNSYAVTFDSKEGSAVSVQEVTYNSMANKPAEDPTKTGYTFGGWYEDVDLTTLYLFTTVVTGDTTLYAKWEQSDYKVTFISNGGTAVSEQTVSYHSTATAPTDPTKTGHKFEGWYTDEGFTSHFQFTTPITGVTTLYANWTANSYTVTFDSDDGSTVSSQAVSYNGTVTSPAEDPTKSGYTFGGWYEDIGFTTPFLFNKKIVGDTILYAKWATGSYAVTFNSTGGSAVNSQAVSYNSTATEPADPTWIGYTFAGWYTDAGLSTAFNFASVIMGNTRLYAKWTTSSSAELSNLIVSDTRLNPVFTTDMTHYTANVFNSIRSVKVTAWVHDRHSVVKVNKTEVTSGQESETINLIEGKNTIVVDVTAQDGSTKAYSVTITRAPAAPVGLVVQDDDGMATLTWESVEGAVYYNVYGGTASRSYGETPIASVSGTTYSYVVSGLTNGTSYYFTVMANSVGGKSLYSNEVIAMPLSGDTSLRSLKLTGITLSPTFETGVYSYTASVTNGTNATSVTAAVYEENASVKIIVNGKEISTAQVNLNVGRNTISIVVTAQNGMTKTYLVTVDRRSSSSGSSSSGSNQEKPPQLQDQIQLMIGDQSYDRIASASMTGEHDLTITLDATRMLDLLEKRDGISVVSMNISSMVDNISVFLPGDVIKAMERKHIVWEIRTPNGNYILPASEIGIDRIAAQFGTDLLKNIIVQVRIGKNGVNGEKWNVNGTGKRQFTFVGQSVDFRIIATYQGKTKEVSKFISYIKREIPLPNGVNPNEVTTAVVRHEDGTLHHVPTYVRSRDGKYFAVIHSLTNSVYALINNQVSFADVDNHWSKNAVNDLASRLIVNGADETHYDPNKAVTRAEFAAIIVRALGLSDIGGTTEFTDVKSSDWYAGAVSQAQEYGIINGYKDGTFRPANTITREEAMALIMRAMKLTGLETAVNATDIEATLSRFAGNEEISAWAKPSVALAAKIGIVNGSDAGLRPTSEITRAETAAIVQRMLRKAKLID